MIVYVAALASAGLVSYASIAWSLTPQASWGDANRWLVAAAAAAAGTLLAALLRRPLEAAVWVLCAASLPFIAYAIQQRARGEIFQTSPRLQGALGYPNAIGAYAALAAPGALWLASAPQRARRVAGCGCLSLLVLGLALSSSRGGVLAALLGCGFWLAVSERRTESGAALLAVLAATAPTARWGLDQPSFKALDVPFTVAAGSHLVWDAAAAVLASPVVGPLAVELAQLAGPRVRRACGIAVLVVAAVGVLLAAVRLSTRYGGPGGAISHVWHQLAGGGAVGSTDHLTQLSTNLRGRWWGEAWDGFTAHPLRGNGAGTFETIDRLAGGFPAGRPGALGVPARAVGHGAPRRDPRSHRAGGSRGLYRGRHATPRSRALRRAPARGRCRRVRAAQPDRLGMAIHGADAARLPDPRADRLQGGHGQRGGDACAATGRCGARGRRPGARRDPVALPVLSNRALARADRLDAQGRVDEARIEADLAAALDRTSVDAQLERASLLQQLGRPDDARRAVEHALSLAPDDDRTWLALAGYQRYCWNDPGWRKSVARARELAGHDTVFAGTDAQVVATSDACTAG